MPTPEGTDRPELEELTLPSRAESLEKFQAFVRSRAQCSQIPPAKLPVLELALEEILVNIISYAHNGKAGLIRVRCGADLTRFIILIEDDGEYFNPLDREEPDTTAAIENRPVGGLGIYLVKSMVDDIRYCRVGESNVLEMALSIHS